MNLLEEIDETIKALEDKIPANPASEKNERLEKGMEKSLSQYFSDLENAIDWNTIEQIYYRNVLQESLGADVNGFIDPILRAFTDNLIYRMNGYMVTAYLKGSAQMIQWGKTKTTDMPIYYEGPPMQQAINYAKKRTATLIEGLNAETRERVRGVIENAIKEKRGVDGLARDLRNQFDNFGKVRSKVIARTETCDALEDAFMDRAKDMGVTGKEWIVTDPCPICEENGKAGAIALDKPFPSGDMRPPAHPNCRCALAPVMIK